MIAANAEGPQSLTHLLTGVFAYSYSGYLADALAAAPAHRAPEIGSYLERTRPATTVAGQRGWEFCDEIDGYVLVDDPDPCPSDDADPTGESPLSQRRQGGCR